MFCKYLFVDEYCNKRINRVKKKITKRKDNTDYYVVEVSGITGRLEFYGSWYLSQSYYDKYDPYIVGIAKDQEGAELIVESIIIQCLSMMGKLDFVSFFDQITKNNQLKNEKLVLIKTEQEKIEG